MFQGRHWPEGFEFPACESCNHGTSNDDLLVAFLARLDPTGQDRNQDGRFLAIMRSVNDEFPGLLEKMIVSSNEARRRNKALGLVPAPGQTHRDTSPVKLPSEMHVAVGEFAKKLAKGVYYQETSKAFPETGCLLLNWFTNIDFVRHGGFIVFDLLKEIAGQVPRLKRSKILLNDQFEYKVSMADDNSIFLLQARFGQMFGLVVAGSAVTGQLESMVEKKREETGSKGPFQVLQSPSLSCRSRVLI